MNDSNALVRYYFFSYSNRNRLREDIWQSANKPNDKKKFYREKEITQKRSRVK